MTPKQERFVKEYMIDLNATQAAIRAGYSEKTAEQQGYQLLQNTSVSAAVAKAMKKRGDKLEITADRVLLEMARLAFSDPRKLLKADGTFKAPSDWDDDTAASVASLEVSHLAGTSTIETSKIKVWDKNSALEKLAKHLDLYAPEKHDHKLDVSLGDTELARKLAFLLTANDAR
jgi:phage terminase small subunit